MSTEANKSLVRCYFEEVSSQANAAAVDQIFSDNVLCHMAGAAEPVVGLAANKAVHVTFLAGFSDMRFVVDDIVAEGDQVSARLTWNMKHTGDCNGIPATGKTVHGGSIEMYRIENGRNAEVWSATDNMSFMQQLGVLPAM
jgi:predicted ester cyclase